MNRDGMPLLCTICERKPSFSDISHLLTHISSKQHLSNYFKIQVQSNGDDEAQVTLDRYDSWYEKWNMGELLKERMDQKEKKKNKAIRRTTTTTTTRKSAKIPKPMSTRTDPRDRLSRQGTPQIKLESAIQPFAPVLSQAFGTNYSSHSMYSTMSPWSMDPPSIKIEQRFSSDGDANGEELEVSAYYAPLPRRRSQRITRQVDFEQDEGSSSGVESDSVADAQEDELKEGIKLKGVVWPGMDLFDSATPEMQRKRNQKKATNVVILLEATSKTVEPKELIFSRSGEFLKQREISGDPAPDSSPLHGETTPDVSSPPVKKKKKTRAKRKTALADKDENSGVTTRRAKKAHSTFGNKRRTTNNESDDDDTLTYRRHGRSGLSIHRDNSGPDITFTRQQSYPYAGYHPKDHDVTYLGHRSLPVQFRPSNTQSMRDMSAFGQLTNVFQPSFNPFMNVDNRHPFNTIDPNAVSNGFHPISTLTHSLTESLPQGYDHHNAWNTGQHSFPSTALNNNWSNYENNAHALNPLFFGSDQIFPEDPEQITTAPTVQQALREDDAETISLASDEK